MTYQHQHSAHTVLCRALTFSVTGVAYAGSGRVVPFDHFSKMLQPYSVKTRPLGSSAVYAVGCLIRRPTGSEAESRDGEHQQASRHRFDGGSLGPSFQQGRMTPSHAGRVYNTRAR